jgi:energy-converting hydrogenase A subunit R
LAKVICFDLEGPLSPQDNAFEVMGLVENGHQLFEAISRYDDLLTLEDRKDYEPGDTLALIVPFLINHNLQEDAISDVSRRAVLVDGADDLIAGLKASGWKVYIISTSYEQHAFNIGAQLGVEREYIYCTKLPLAQYLRDVKEDDLKLVADIENALLDLLPIEGKDEELNKLLDDFYWKTLKGTPLGDIIENMKVVGGARKVDAARKVSEACSCPFSELAVVGDSITDFKMLGAVHEAGGLAAAFNANIYAIPYATISLASENLNDLRPVLDAFAEGGRPSALSSMESVMSSQGGVEKYHFHDLAGREEYDDILEIHKKYRTLVRGKAAKLG